MQFLDTIMSLEQFLEKKSEIVNHVSIDEVNGLFLVLNQLNLLWL